MPATEHTRAPLHPSIDIRAWETAEHDSGVIIANGSQVTITVRNGHLTIIDGPPKSRRERRYPRVPRDIQRLLILAGHGYRTIEAERWLADAGVPWSVIDTYDSDRPVAVSGPQRHDARLLRAQAYAPLTDTGIEVTRLLLGSKLTGQERICRDILHMPDAAHDIAIIAASLPAIGDLDTLRNAEASAAVTYWASWAGRVWPPLSPDSLDRVPARWHVFNGRTSDMREYRSNRYATDPVNAMLNYIYRIAESEAVHACHALGLSPLLGIMHADTEDRDSFALDLIEAVRPHCDRIILGMLDTGLGIPYTPDGKPAYLDRRWFYEDRTGQCRLEVPLTHRLASSAADIGAVLRPYAESCARILAASVPGNVRVPAARKPPKPNRVPVTSYRPARLRDGITLNDLIPDDLWERISGLIPPVPELPSGRRRTGVKRDTGLDRDAVAVAVATELLRVPYASINARVSAVTVRGRLREWQWTRNGTASCWERIVSEVQGHGHLSGLLAVP